MIYTNVKIKGKGIKAVTVKELTQMLKSSKWLGLDTETSPKEFNAEKFIESFLAGVHKVTATTIKVAAKRAEERRLECLTDPFLSNVAYLQALLDTDNIVVVRLLDLGTAPYRGIMKAISNKPLLGQNLKFDLKVLTANSPDFKAGEVFDTMIAHRIYQHSKIIGKFKSNLQFIVQFYLGIELKKGHGVDDWSVPQINKEQFMYCVEDVKYLKLIMLKQLELLNDTSIRKVFTSHAYFNKSLIDLVSIIEMRFVKCLADIELSGFPINMEELKKRAVKMKQELTTKRKFFDKAGVNTQSPAQIMEYFKNHPKVDIMDTTRGELSKFKEVPVIRKLLEVKKLQKELQMIEDYVDVWQKEGRIYSDFNQIRAATGRMSCYNPNSQQIPRSLKKILYKPSEGRVIIKADYPTIEARIMSIIANDETMKNIFRQGLDVHLETARTLLGKKKITDEERFRTKAVNFGFLYGMGVLSFTKYAWEEFNLVYSLQEATDLRNTFMHKYSGIARFHNSNSAALREQLEITRHTLLGRKMKVDKFTLANNYPVQGTGADILKLAATVFYDYLEQSKIEDAHIVNLVHDEIVVECKFKDRTKVKRLLKNAMEVSADYTIQEFKTPVEVEEVK